MDPFPDILDDGDLRLRPMDVADLPDVTRQLSDPRVARWLAAVTQPFDAAELIRHGQHPGEAVRVIDHGGSVIGGLCLGAALWYWLAPEHWGQGWMRRALTCAITARFARHAPPIIATCHTENAASRALLTRLGFAPSPKGRRMFFHGTQQSELCRDYLLAPEQWHLLHPPVLSAGRTTLRPAQQKDAPQLAYMLPRGNMAPWPAVDDLPGFIETHRYRGAGRGLFVIADDMRRDIGMVLIGPGPPRSLYLSEEDATRHGATIEEALGAVTSRQSFR